MRERRTRWRRMQHAAARVILSVMGGGLAFAASLVLTLLTQSWQTALWDMVVWLQAPIVTAAGFTGGLVLGGRLTGSRPVSFLRLYLWPLAGCILGAAVGFPFGPMLFVAGMLAAGFVSVALREMLGRVASQPLPDSRYEENHGSG